MIVPIKKWSMTKTKQIDSFPVCDSFEYFKQNILIWFSEILKILNWIDIFFIAKKNHKKRINKILSVPRTDRKMIMIFYGGVEIHSKKSMPFGRMKAKEEVATMRDIVNSLEMWLKINSQSGRKKQLRIFIFRSFHKVLRIWIRI